MSVVLCYKVHTLLVEILVGFGGSCQELAEGPGNGQVFNVCRHGIARDHSAHSWHQVRSYSLRLQTHTQVRCDALPELFSCWH